MKLCWNGWDGGSLRGKQMRCEYGGWEGGAVVMLSRIDKSNADNEFRGNQ